MNERDRTVGICFRCQELRWKIPTHTNCKKCRNEMIDPEYKNAVAFYGKYYLTKGGSLLPNKWARWPYDDPSSVTLDE